MSGQADATSDGVAVRLGNVRKTYGEVVAVDRVDLSIATDEFFTMLGPSGSGKTTCLRMIAGFERPDEGVVELGGRDVTGVPPYDRDVNTVFQDYALFPHMTVGENVVSHRKQEWVRAQVHTNTVEGVWSLLKRSVVGTYHQLSAKHLPAYLDEISFRFNNRENPWLFRDTVLRLLDEEPLRYRKLIHG